MRRCSISRPCCVRKEEKSEAVCPCYHHAVTPPNNSPFGPQEVKGTKMARGLVYCAVRRSDFGVAIILARRQKPKISCRSQVALGNRTLESPNYHDPSTTTSTIPAAHVLRTNNSTSILQDSTPPCVAAEREDGYKGRRRGAPESEKEDAGEEAWREPGVAVPIALIIPHTTRVLRWGAYTSHSIDQRQAEAFIARPPLLGQHKAQKTKDEGKGKSGRKQPGPSSPGSSYAYPGLGPAARNRERRKQQIRILLAVGSCRQVRRHHEPHENTARVNGMRPRRDRKRDDAEGGLEPGEGVSLSRTRPVPSSPPHPRTPPSPMSSSLPFDPRLELRVSWARLGGMESRRWETSGGEPAGDAAGGGDDCGAGWNLSLANAGATGQSRVYEARRNAAYTLNGRSTTRRCGRDFISMEKARREKPRKGGWAQARVHARSVDMSARGSVGGLRPRVVVRPASPAPTLQPAHFSPLPSRETKKQTQARGVARWERERHRASLIEAFPATRDGAAQAKMDRDRSWAGGRGKARTNEGGLELEEPALVPVRAGLKAHRKDVHGDVESKEKFFGLHSGSTRIARTRQGMRRSRLGGVDWTQVTIGGSDARSWSRYSTDEEWERPSSGRVAQLEDGVWRDFSFRRERGARRVGISASNNPQTDVRRELAAGDSIRQRGDQSQDIHVRYGRETRREALLTGVEQLVNRREAA
ncbi:hypothetical protein B0H16DRAFT_1686713 [Mycena metata]|uniref:Uncharacterized protein n=1 Tax=Mycena metata TaxID=1033252 RepID=A0AAD7JQ41_9AGAR|nr:hypothetical protein B0H16DRAFT_1686713 [Mycena metata]